jgi:hypothetical protein
MEKLRGLLVMKIAPVFIFACPTEIIAFDESIKEFEAKYADGLKDYSEK